MRRDLLDLMQLRTTAKWGFFMSLDIAAALWYRETALRTKPGSRNTYITAYMYMASDHIGSVRIRKITPGLIEDLYHRLRSRGSTSSALAGLHAALCSIFSHATSRGVISHNPMTQVNTQTLKKPGIRELPEKTPPQFMEYVKNKNPQTYLILFLLLNTGLRVGELGGLLWDCVDLEKGYIHVRRNLLKLDKRITGFPLALCSPKSSSSIRRIPLGDDLWNMLAEYKEKPRNQVPAVPVIDDSGVITGYESDFVFATQRRGPITRNALQKRLRRVVNSYCENVDPDMQYFNIHSIRHMFATNVYEVVQDPKLLSSLLGHKSVRTTLDIYTHLTEDSERRMRDLVNRLGERE